MPWGNPTFGGNGGLVIPSIHSPGYTPGVTGWTLNKDGSFELGGGSFRGDVIIDGSNGAQIHLYDSASVGAPSIDLQPGSFAGPPAMIYSTLEGGVGPQASLILSSPTAPLGSDAATLILTSGDTGTPDTVEASLYADIISLTNFGPVGQLRIGMNTIIGSGMSVVDSLGINYLKGQTDTKLCSFAASTSANIAVVFPTAFPAGTVPTVTLNINESTAATIRWTVSAHTISNTGFTIRAANPAGAAASAWTNVPVQWTATVPG